MKSPFPCFFPSSPCALIQERSEKSSTATTVVCTCGCTFCFACKHLTGHEPAPRWWRFTEVGMTCCLMCPCGRPYSTPYTIYILLYDILYIIYIIIIYSNYYKYHLSLHIDFISFFKALVPWDDGKAPCQAFADFLKDLAVVRRQMQDVTWPEWSNEKCCRIIMVLNMVTICYYIRLVMSTLH